jgi:hypothetical protein
MGTNSELFLSGTVVHFDVLVDCRKLPAAVTGALLADLKLGSLEMGFMKELLAYLKANWKTEEAPDYIRSQFRKYVNSVFTALLRVRHIKIIPSFAWPYLDWERTMDVFGRHFILELRQDKAVTKIILEQGEEAFDPFDERFLVKRKI